METKRERKVVIVFDTSGSMENLVEIFGLSDKLYTVQLPLGAQFDTKHIEELLQKYEHVFVITDEYGKMELGSFTWHLIFDHRLHIINVAELLHIK